MWPQYKNSKNMEKISGFVSCIVIFLQNETIQLHPMSMHNKVSQIIILIKYSSLACSPLYNEFHLQMSRPTVLKWPLTCQQILSCHSVECRSINTSAVLEWPLTCLQINSCHLKEHCLSGPLLVNTFSCATQWSIGETIQVQCQILWENQYKYSVRYHGRIKISTVLEIMGEST